MCPAGVGWQSVSALHEESDDMMGKRESQEKLFYTGFSLEDRVRAENPKRKAQARARQAVSSKNRVLPTKFH